MLFRSDSSFVCHLNSFLWNLDPLLLFYILSILSPDLSLPHIPHAPFLSALPILSPPCPEACVSSIPDGRPAGPSPCLPLRLPLLAHCSSVRLVFPESLEHSTVSQSRTAALLSPPLFWVLLTIQVSAASASSWRPSLPVLSKVTPSHYIRAPAFFQGPNNNVW